MMSVTDAAAAARVKPFNWDWLDWADIRSWLAEQPQPIVPTIGYGYENFAERLADASVLVRIAKGLGARKIIDVRAQPSGARVREPFRQGRIKDAIAAAGVDLEYVWRGNELGGTHRYRGRGVTDDGLRWLDELARRERVMLLCMCGRREGCHICRIIAADLIDRTRRAELRLPPDRPTFLHLYLDGSYVDGDEMLRASDEDRARVSHGLQALPQHLRAAEYWRDVYTHGLPLKKSLGYPG